MVTILWTSSILVVIGLIVTGLALFHRRERPDGHAGWCRRCSHPVANGVAVCAECDSVGIAPAWDPTEGTAELDSASTALDPVDVTSGFALGLLYHASVNGGTFDVTFAFENGDTPTVVLDVPDWFSDGNHLVAPPGDGGGLVDVADLVEVIVAWGRCP
ncbi:MAG: hypothetical protein ACYTF9_00525 [Planctomycetota bacterium]|jgi:hypothetical protein